MRYHGRFELFLGQQAMLTLLWEKCHYPSHPYFLSFFSPVSLRPVAPGICPSNEVTDAVDVLLYLSIDFRPPWRQPFYTIQESSHNVSAEYFQPLHRSGNVHLVFMNDRRDDVMECNSSGEFDKVRMHVLKYVKAYVNLYVLPQCLNSRWWYTGDPPPRVWQFAWQDVREHVPEALIQNLEMTLSLVRQRSLCGATDSHWQRGRAWSPDLRPLVSWTSCTCQSLWWSGRHRHLLAQSMQGLSARICKTLSVRRQHTPFRCLPLHKNT